MGLPGVVRSMRAPDPDWDSAEKLPPRRITHGYDSRVL